MKDNTNKQPPIPDHILRELTSLPTPSDKPSGKTNKLDNIMKMAMILGVVLLVALIGLWWMLRQTPTPATEVIESQPAQSVPADGTPEPATLHETATSALDQSQLADNNLIASNNAGLNGETALPATDPANTNTAAASDNAAPQAIPKSIQINPVTKVDPNQLPSDTALLKEVHDKEQDLEKQMLDQKAILEKQLETSNNIVKVKSDQIAEIEKQLKLLEKAGK